MVVPASAAAIGFTGLNGSPADTQAGANSNFNIHVGFTSAGDDVKNIRIGLPPGQIGDPTATPYCTVAQLNTDSCPANTIVGDVSTTVAALSLLPLTVTGNLYNLEPPPGAPAHFGIALHALPINIPVFGDVLLPPIILQSAVELRQGDFGLDTVITNIPNQAEVLSLGGLPLLTAPIDITAMDVTLLGTANGNPFARNPTSCAEATTNFSATSYTGSTTVTPATGQASYTPTGCGSLPFSPTLSGRLGAPGLTASGKKTPLTTVIEQDDGEAGLRTATVVLPAEIGADVSELYRHCPTAQFQASTCPQSAVIGQALATSPVLPQPLSGPVLLVGDSDIPGIGLDLSGPLSLKLTGNFTLAGTSTFDDLPDIPISHFELSFLGAPSGLLLTARNICLPPTPVFGGDFVAHSDTTLQTTTPGVVEGCPSPADPTLKAKLRGARSTQPRLVAKVRAGSGEIGKVTLALPKGLSLAKGAAFARGIRARMDGSKLQRSQIQRRGRKLTITPPLGGFRTMKLRLAAGAVIAKRAVKKPRLKATVTDVDGIVTRLAAKAKG